jgi:hypothetical protein
VAGVGFAAVGLYQRFDREPRIVIADEGLYLYSMGDTPIVWEHITMAYTREIGNDRTHLHIELADPEAVKKQFPDRGGFNHCQWDRL